MGDRCYVEITVRREDLSRWLALGYDMEHEDDCVSECVDLYDSERNYGVSDAPDDVAAGCPMFGSHEEGGDYGASLFAYDGLVFMERETTRDGRLVVSVDPATGEPHPEELRQARKFLEFSRNVGRLVGDSPAWTVPDPTWRDTASFVGNPAGSGDTNG